MSTATTDPSSTAPSPMQWLQCMELGYTTPDATTPEPVCFRCGKPSSDATKLSKCAKCHVASYCSRDCQVQDWKTNHKHSCAAYKRVGMQMSLSDNAPDVKAARQDVFGRVRFYACPYAVYKHLQLGRGFLFVQSAQTLAELSLPQPKTSTGQVIAQRSLLIHYLTLGEFDSEVCRDDFELAQVRTALMKAVKEYNEQTSLVLLMRFRCGHVALGVAQLVPDYGICKSLGKDYFANNTAGALQLNLDDL